MKKAVNNRLLWVVVVVIAITAILSIDYFSANILFTPPSPKLDLREDSLEQDISFPDEPTSCVQPPSGMVAWWPADVSDAPQYAVEIINNNDGYLQNGVDYQPGKVGTAFSFDGVDDFIEVPDDDVLDVTSVTIDAWIYPTDLIDFEDTLVLKDDSYGIIGDNSGRITCFVRTQDDEENVYLGYIPLSSSFPLNTWSHVACTYDEMDGTGTIYLNGQPVVNGYTSGGLEMDIPNNLYIGGTDFGQTFFKGLIDEVEIFNRALTEEEIRSIYEAGSYGKCRPADECEIITEELKIETPTNRFNLGNKVSEIVQTVGYQQFPTTLKKGTYLTAQGTQHTYGQTLTLDPSGTMRLIHFQDADYEAQIGLTESTPTIGVPLQPGARVFNYALDFVQDPQSPIVGNQLTSFQNTEIEIMGKKYLITTFTSNPKKITMTQVLTGDIFELAHGQDVKINGETIGGVKAYIDLTPGARPNMKFDKLRIEWTTNDEEFIAQAADLHFPGFDSFYWHKSEQNLWQPDIPLTWSSGNIESFLVAPSGFSPHIQLYSVPLQHGVVTIPILYSTNGVYAGTGVAENLELATTKSDTLIFDGDVHEQFVASYKSQTSAESYLLRATGFITESGISRVTLIENVGGENWIVLCEDKQAGEVCNVGSVSLNLIEINAQEETVIFTASPNVVFDKVYTKEGLEIQLPVECTSGTCGGIGDFSPGVESFSLRFNEEDKDGNIGIVKLDIKLGHLNGLPNVHYPIINVDGIYIFPDYGFERGNTGVFESYLHSDLATKIFRTTSSEQDFAKIVYLTEEAYGEVYLVGQVNNCPDLCGNGVVNPGEECDGTDFNNLTCEDFGFNGGPLSCTQSCTIHSFDCWECGNGVIDTGEECDDGNLLNGDGCNDMCELEMCGDGICQIQLGESCVSCSVDCGVCSFVPGTEVSTYNENVEIQNLKEGEVIMSYNEATGKLEPSRVMKVFVHEVGEYLLINGKLGVTPSHPLFINGEWKAAGLAKIGDYLKNLDGEEQIMSIVPVEEQTKVYNLNVDRHHNFYADGFLSHNKCDPECGNCVDGICCDGVEFCGDYQNEAECVADVCNLYDGNPCWWSNFDQGSCNAHA